MDQKNPQRSTLIFGDGRKEGGDTQVFIRYSQHLHEQSCLTYLRPSGRQLHPFLSSRYTDSRSLACATARIWVLLFINIVPNRRYVKMPKVRGGREMSKDCKGKTRLMSCSRKFPLHTIYRMDALSALSP